jgi:hypothetical protein
VQEKLLCNRKALLHVLNDQKERVLSKDYLKGAGFDFGYYTHNHTLKDNTIMHMVFDYGVIKVSENNFKVVRNA